MMPSSLKTRPPKDATDALRSVPLFSRCSDKELRVVAGLCTEISVPGGRDLAKYGQVGREFFILLSGAVGCRVAGREVARFGSGEFFGEMSLLDGQPRSAELHTLSEVTLLVLNRREFVALVEASPAIALKMLAGMAGRLRVANRSAIAADAADLCAVEVAG